MTKSLSIIAVVLTSAILFSCSTRTQSIFDNRNQLEVAVADDLQYQLQQNQLSSSKHQTNQQAIIEDAEISEIFAPIEVAIAKPQVEKIKLNNTTSKSTNSSNKSTIKAEIPVSTLTVNAHHKLVEATEKVILRKLTLGERIKLRFVEKIQKMSLAGKGEKSQLTALLLAFFLGFLGVHRFYLGYVGIGVIQLLTAGGCGIWALVDFIRIILGTLEPANGPYDQTL